MKNKHKFRRIPKIKDKDYKSVYKLKHENEN